MPGGREVGVHAAACAALFQRQHVVENNTEALAQIQRRSSLNSCSEELQLIVGLRHTS